MSLSAAGVSSADEGGAPACSHSRGVCESAENTAFGNALNYVNPAYSARYQPPISTSRRIAEVRGSVATAAVPAIRTDAVLGLCGDPLGSPEMSRAASPQHLAMDLLPLTV